MAHLRKRHIQAPVSKLSAFSPIVGIFGHRQVGKTTFLENNFKEYKSLDDETEYRKALNSPKEYINEFRSNKGCVIDECQLVPTLFPALKLRVQRDKRPGQFFLSGSVRFTSKKSIRESLTGRLAHAEMYPFVVSELLEDSLPQNCKTLLDSASLKNAPSFFKNLESQHSLKQKTLVTYMEKGGMPGLCFIRDETTRNKILKDILATMLDRDLRQIVETKLPLTDLIGLCQYISSLEFTPLSLEATRKETGLSVKTIKNLIYSFESIFLLRKIHIEGTGKSGHLFFFEDQLEHNFLNNFKTTDAYSKIGLLYRNIRAELDYSLTENVEFFSYRSRAGSSVPLAVRTKSGVLGFYPIEEFRSLSRAEKASIDSFLKTYIAAKVVVLAFGAKFDIQVINDRILVAPASIMF